VERDTVLVASCLLLCWVLFNFLSRYLPFGMRGYQRGMTRNNVSTERSCEAGLPGGTGTHQEHDRWLFPWFLHGAINLTTSSRYIQDRWEPSWLLGVKMGGHIQGHDNHSFRQTLGGDLEAGGSGCWERERERKAWHGMGLHGTTRLWENEAKEYCINGIDKASVQAGDLG